MNSQVFKIKLAQLLQNIKISFKYSCHKFNFHPVSLDNILNEIKTLRNLGLSGHWYPYKHD